MTSKELVIILACYGVGCFTAGYYWTRWRTGRDIREEGSGNVGARNVGRALGPSGFTFTLLLDAAKGALATALAVQFHLGSDALIAAMVAVVVGHNWPMQLRFHGGKGIATSIGALLAYDPLIPLILVAVFLPTLILLRNFTLSGMFAFSLAPAFVLFCGLGNAETVASSLLAILALISHRKNIQEELARLLLRPRLKEGASGKENNYDL